MKKILIVLGCLFLCSCLFAAEVNRYAVYVGSNRGGKNRTNLLYAGTDAEAIRNTMKEIGGIPDNNGVLLIDPSKKEIEAAISNISKKIKSNNSNGRSEFLFYYSGHSDEDSLLLGENRFDYSDLKAKISDVPSDVHVVILDSCYSGNFIRTKGGVKQKPFLIDDSSVVKGHAYLSSSSENEYSQESDEVEGSFFTNALVSGLRGAADADKDKKVTLNELYSYAFNDTLSKTEETQAGPQHPNYNITLVGSGDLVLSDFSDAEALVTIARELEGKVLIRDKNDKLVSEVNKLAGTPVIMALSEGDYTVTVITAAKTVQGNIKITKK
ncbi:MAG: caspase family protein, partial [Treponema sp.]|nr:caspase family protein [Treponema sp.]